VKPVDGFRPQLQMILNFVWSPAFFTLHHIAFALAIILTLLAVIQR